MANLFDINAQITALWDRMINPETGEVDSRAYELCDALTLERDEKIENIACWIKNLRSDAEALKAEAKAMQDRSAAAARKADRLQDYLARALNGEKFQTVKVSIGWRRSTAVQVSDPDELPDNFVKEVIERRPDLAGLKDVLKTGVAVPGAQLVERNNIQIK